MRSFFFSVRPHFVRYTGRIIANIKIDPGRLSEIHARTYIFGNRICFQTIITRGKPLPTDLHGCFLTGSSSHHIPRRFGAIIRGYVRHLHNVSTEEKSKVISTIFVRARLPAKFNIHLNIRA